MKKTFDLYGSEVDDIELCRRRVEAALGVTFTAHESSYLGNYYRWGEQYGEELLLQKNFDESEQEFREDKFKQAKVLLYVNMPRDPERIRRELDPGTGVMFLARKEL